MSNTKKLCETEQEFTLLLGGVDVTEEVADALFEAGCDDATLSKRYGNVYLSFSRYSPSLGKAIISAIVDVCSADIGAIVVRVDQCNLVTQSEIARRTQRSRQNIHQYIKGERGPGSFPAQACSIAEGSPLYYWCEVVEWLWENSLVKREEVEEANEVTTINNVLEIIRHRSVFPELTERILQEMDFCCN